MQWSSIQMLSCGCNGPRGDDTPGWLSRASDICQHCPGVAAEILILSLKIVVILTTQQKWCVFSLLTQVLTLKDMGNSICTYCKILWPWPITGWILPWFPFTSTYCKPKQAWRSGVWHRKHGKQSCFCYSSPNEKPAELLDEVLELLSIIIETEVYWAP